MAHRRHGPWLAATLGGLLGLALLWPAPGASAHALLSASDPAKGATLQAPPAQIVLTFTETIDFKNSLIQVIDTAGKVWAGGHPDPVAGQPATVARLPVTATLPKGVYTVNYKTVSTVDGHLVANSYAFGVQTSPAGVTSRAPVVTQPGASEVATVSRWCYLVGLIGLLGLAFTELVVLGAVPPPEARRRLGVTLALSWLLGFGGALGILQAERAGAGLAPSGVLGSSLGHAFLLRALPLVIAGAALLAVRRASAGRRRRALAVVAVAALGSMLADVLRGHAAAATSWTWLQVTAQWLHVAAAGIWIGGLAGLLLCLGPLGAGHRLGPARRFSLWAGVAIVMVGITGTFRAFNEVGSWRGLLHTGFGQLVGVKILLFGVLGALGALNRFRNVEAADSGPHNLRRVGTAELATMALVLAATALLQNLAPARTVLASTNAATAAADTTGNPPPIVAEASDFAQTYKLHLAISPGTAGFDTYTLQVRNYLTGAAVTAGNVSITFAAPNNPGVGSSDLTLARQRDGSYMGTGANLSLLGEWRLTITVENGLNAVEVPVTVVTASPAQPVRAQPFANSPTFYNIAVGGGAVIQVYIDPLNAFGKAEFHATFMDTNGTELTMQPALAVNAQRVPGGAATEPFAYRDLDNLGHFVADATVAKGTYSFNVVGTTVTGTALGATITLPVT